MPKTNNLVGDTTPNMLGPAYATPEEYAKLCRMRLMLSVDLQSSTSLKHYGHINTEEPWILTFEMFYEDFPAVLQEAYDRHIPAYCSEEPFETANRLRVFKFLGDEILFEVTIESHEETLFHIQAVKYAIREFNRRLALEYKTLRCKPAAWLAGFPVTNTEISLPTLPGNTEPVMDYIGPSIDLGFRLSKWATPRKLILSYDLAKMLIDAMDNKSVKSNSANPTFFYDGSEPLSGILNEAPYPRIWIDLDDGSRPLEEKLKGIAREPCRSGELRDFCEEFRNLHGIFPWFIATDAGPVYGMPPNDSWVEKYRIIQEKRAAFQDKRSKWKSEKRRGNK